LSPVATPSLTVKELEGNVYVAEVAFRTTSIAISLPV
jgi:hypothetical protein